MSQPCCWAHRARPHQHAVGGLRLDVFQQLSVESARQRLVVEAQRRLRRRNAALASIASVAMLALQAPPPSWQDRTAASQSARLVSTRGLHAGRRGDREGLASGTQGPSAGGSAPHQRVMQLHEGDGALRGAHGPMHAPFQGTHPLPIPPRACEAPPGAAPQSVRRRCGQLRLPRAQQKVVVTAAKPDEMLEYCSGR